MEQKQLDELDESFGEEFVDDDPEIRIAPANASKSKKLAKTAKTAKTIAKKIPDALDIKGIQAKAEAPNLEPKSAVETTPPVNPWAEEKDKTDDPGLFSETSTWKAITGIVIILLLLSVFTQGFRFSGKSGPTLSQEEAQQKALNFVNGNLLQPPFEATVKASKEVGNFYLITLSVAGQSVDSYITKDGGLFFPQGFDTSKSLAELAKKKQQLEEPDVKEISVGEPEAALEDTKEPAEEPVKEEPATPLAPTKEVPAAAPAEPGVTELSITARKWAFSPFKVTAHRGDKVRLTIVPQSLAFTFSIPVLGIQKDVSGETVLEFTADKTGSFQFLCSSCEDWRGMTGTLVVE